MNKIVSLAIAAVFAGGCAERGIVDNSAIQTDGVTAAAVASPGAPGLTVMTWNVYYGTDPTPILVALQANPGSVPFVVDSVWELTKRTNFPERAGALARAIAAKAPHLVGVQEAALWRTGAFFGSTPAEDTIFDFLVLLKDSLQARGMNYVIATAATTTDIELPAISPRSGAMFDVRLTDRDAVLARADVAIKEQAAAPYIAFFEVFPGTGVGIREGWASVVATMAGQEYRFVSTHIEVQGFLDVQKGQVHELIDLLKSETRPTIVVGDFNDDVFGADPSAAGVSYDSMTAAGFTDRWLRPGGAPPGLTCCQNDSVSNLQSLFNQRVDFILTRHMPEAKPAGTLATAWGIVGDRRGDRTPSGLWPSDHGGVVATFLTPPVGPRGNVVAE